ncbi:AraC family transcriptional regulator [Balneatrix alpica]|uniref:AraC family transcriptional regulator n=1 Tax=Balneatrix alpica TaxID=75684 RepID=UPI002738E49F|nr:AraC family transcriptional regulator [Balneatrix alpica]
MVQARVLELPTQQHSHDHDYHQLILGLHGQAEFDIAGQGGLVNRHSACIVPGNRSHGYQGSRDNHVLILDIDAHNPQDEALIARLFNLPRYLPIDQEIQQLLGFARHELQLHQQDQAFQHCLSGLLLRSLYQRLEQPPLQTKQLKLDMARIDQLIKGNLHRRLSISELAGSLCISPSHFHALFKEATGLTPHQYLNRARVEQALHLLQHSQLSLAEVADQCGFCNQSAFTQALRQHTGHTPGYWRKHP